MSPGTFRFCQADTLAELAEAVDAAIAEGFRVIGPPRWTAGCWLQTTWKE